MCLPPECPQLPPPDILVQNEGSCVKWPLTSGFMIDSPAVPVAQRKAGMEDGGGDEFREEE